LKKIFLYEKSTKKKIYEKRYFLMKKAQKRKFIKKISKSKNGKIYKNVSKYQKMENFIKKSQKLLIPIGISHLSCQKLSNTLHQ
jgi:mevalonate kinase